MLGAGTVGGIDRRISAGRILLAVVIASLLNACGNSTTVGTGGNASGSGDTAPPSQPANLTATAAGSTGANLSWTASSDNVAVTGYIVRRNGVQVATPVATSYFDSGLSPATTYSYTVVARDAAGNMSNPASASVKTAASGGGGDTTPPSQPSNFTATAAGSTGANLSWTASTDNVAVTGYIVSRNGTQIAAPATTSFSDSGLSPATTYNYTVAARDAAGNMSTPASASVTTAVGGGGGDTTPPSQPTGFSATAAGSTGANLLWTASSDNVGVTGYIVTRNGAQIATVVTTSFVDSTLSPATPYIYTVAARDAAGNTSTAASASITTASAPPPYYVATTTGNDSNSCAAAQSASTPRKTIKAGLGCLAPGGTLIIRDGTYSGSANALSGLPNGSPGNYITIKAENEGNVIITAGLDMAHTNAYLIFQGLRFQDSEGRNILGNHLKFFRNEFKGGCVPSGNCSNTGVGTNDFNDTADILLEDNWWHGLGGRYNLLIYNANRVVVRRGVIRHDGGWNDSQDSGDPEAGLNFYNSTNCSAQNVIVLDSNLSTYSTWQSAFYSTQNSQSPNANTKNSWLGIIALNDFSDGAGGLRFDGNDVQTNHVVKDAVLWDVYSGLNVSYQAPVGLTASGLTIGQTMRGSVGIGIEGDESGTKSFTNVIIANMNDDDIASVSGPVTFFDTYNNGNPSSGTGRVTYSPFSNGLLYLPRIEAAGALKTAGLGGGQIGAQIVSRIGAAGTLQGEPGWDGDTGAALWPFPNEARIMKEMCTDASITRGFCSDTSLTNYIMNYLGNGNPY